jgi:uncharacterized ferritin-like protein (DUF455 family)
MFVDELEAFKTDRVAVITRAGELSLASEPAGDPTAMLKIALANEISVSELAAAWVPTTREVDVKIAFARQTGDEAGHFQLVSQRLAALGFDVAAFEPPADNPLFAYLKTLTSTVERVAAGLFTLESIAYTVNEQFMAFCERRGDAETVRIYREYIQPDERAHQRLGHELLARYAMTAEQQTLAREAVARVIAIAGETRSKAAERIGAACFPGC